MLVMVYPDSGVLFFKPQRPDTYASVISGRAYSYDMDIGGKETHVSIQSEVVEVVAKVCIL